MNAEQLYKKLAELRDQGRATSRIKSRMEEDVFVQLLPLPFTNEYQPDELPAVFNINNVMFTKKDFEHLMKRIGLNVTVELTRNNFATGNSFRVTQKS